MRSRRTAVVLVAAALSVSAAPLAGRAERLPLNVARWRLRQAGNTVKWLPVDQRVELIVTLVNNTGRRLRGVRSYVAEMLEGSLLDDRWADVGDIPAKGTGDAVYHLRYSPKRCAPSVFFVFEFVPTQNGFPQIDIPTRCPGPLLGVSVLDSRFDGGDGDGMAEPGEHLSFRLELFNSAGSVSRGVHGTLRIDTPGVRLLQGRSDWPDIPAHGRRTSRALFVVDISPDAERYGTSCESLEPPRPAGYDCELAVRFMGVLAVDASDGHSSITFDSGQAGRIFLRSSASPSPAASRPSATRGPALAAATKQAGRSGNAEVLAVLAAALVSAAWLRARRRSD